MNKRIQVLSSHLGIKESEIRVQNENIRWYETNQNVYRVLKEDEIKEECLEEIKECWYDWRYKPKTLMKFLNLPLSFFTSVVGSDGWIYLDSANTDNTQYIQELIYKKGVEAFALFIFDEFKNENNVDWLLDKVTNKATKAGNYTIYQWT